VQARNVYAGSFENDLETVVSGTQIRVAIARNWSEQMAGCLPRSVDACAADGSMVGLTQGTGANVLVRAESRPAGLKAQQAQKPTVGAGDSGASPPGCGHRPAHFGQASPRRHGAACKPSQRRSGNIKGLAPGDVVAFHDSLQVPGRADDESGMDMIVAEEVPYLTDGGGQRMPCGDREHHLGSGAQDLIHRTRIRTTIRTWSPLCRHPRSCHIPHQRVRVQRQRSRSCTTAPQATRNPHVEDGQRDSGHKMQVMT
jgi:hypothetical protein